MTRARHIPDEGDFEGEGRPGSFRLIPGERQGEYEFAYICPCGCGAEGWLLVGHGHKPMGRRASWRWNGSTSAPTLDPSVNHVGHWHGWLRDGVWKEV
ncbi:DUF6527 family protein [Albimonas pacifica]|uniref:Uncharacterized protein n=1 Tax=Albimonas pacifica TaxID=1114924 RepID=A0A1I3QRR1_9RHOB|nr:DUF6527 family protein [Albimonas pacifica]SFJ36943.1 hypothetical protein SAMN05216258_1613 [Albimonas pacifica]